VEKKIKVTDIEENPKLKERLAPKVRLILRVNYFTSICSLVFCCICLFALDIKEVIPWVFLSFGILNLLNIVLYYYHKNIRLTYNIVSILTLTGASIITLYSGGINSPFIFVLALVVVAGYVATKSYGSLYLNLNLLIINLLNAHHTLYKTKSQLEAKINEKDTLLKEVHHRVKNNLQTVSSLLSLQARNVDDADTKLLFKSSQNRVISMAMVHEMLYMREDISKIGYKSYVQELAEYLVRSIKGTSSNITLDIDIPDVKLNIDTAIPLGLLINEAVTNALKYGIVDDSQGIIFIRLYYQKRNTLYCEVP